MIIYVIKNKLNNKIYVGQTINSLEQRWSEHRYSSKKLRCNAIHGAILKYGIEAFEINILETLSEDATINELNEREIWWINKLNCIAPNGYNLRRGGLNGGKHNEETKRKMSLSAIGKHSQKRGPMSVSHRKKLSEAHMGKAPWNKGISHSEEAIDKMRKARKIIKLSVEQKEKISISLKGRVFSTEHKKKLDKARYGRKLSAETKEKIRQTLLKRKKLT